MSRQRPRRRSQKAQRHAAARAVAPASIVREATRVERFAYTRSQAAAALGISRSTFDRRVLPLIETIEMPWGTTLVPVDELERVIAERRRPARPPAQPANRGRPPGVSRDIADDIRAKREAGRTLREIADELNRRGVPTAHGGARWWASTVRAVLGRSAA